MHLARANSACVLSQQVSFGPINGPWLILHRLDLLWMCVVQLGSWDLSGSHSLHGRSTKGHPKRRWKKWSSEHSRWVNSNSDAFDGWCSSGRRRVTAWYTHGLPNCIHHQRNRLMGPVGRVLSNVGGHVFGPLQLFSHGYAATIDNIRIIRLQ